MTSLLSHTGRPLGESEVLKALKVQGAPEDGAVPINQKQLEKEMAMNATVRDAVDIAHLKAAQAMNHLGNQIPDLVRVIAAQVVAEAMAGFITVIEERYQLTPREDKPSADNPDPKLETEWFTGKEG